MFRQLVTPPPGVGNVNDNINSLFIYHPLQISAIIETVWLNRNNAASSQTSSPFLPWSPQISYPILSASFFPGYDWTTNPPTPLPPGAAGVLPPPNFTPPLTQPGIAGTWNGLLPMPNRPPLEPTNWDHPIYAYLIESTRIFDIFSKVLETYMYSEQLETPSPASQLFWRN